MAIIWISLHRDQALSAENEFRFVVCATYKPCATKPLIYGIKYSEGHLQGYPHVVKGSESSGSNQPGKVYYYHDSGLLVLVNTDKDEVTPPRAHDEDWMEDKTIRTKAVQTFSQMLVAARPINLRRFS